MPNNNANEEETLTPDASAATDHRIITAIGIRLRTIASQLTRIDRRFANREFVTPEEAKIILEGATNWKQKASEVLDGELTFEIEVRCTELMDRADDIRVKAMKSINRQQPEDRGELTARPTEAKSASTPSISLPPIQIKVFNGEPSEWSTFWDAFDAHIHKNNGIPTIAKHTYLLTKLEGSALDAVSHLSQSAEDYSLAITILKSRFAKPVGIARSYVQQIENLVVPEQQSEAHLNMVANVLRRADHGMNLLGKSFDSRQPWMIAMAINKIDPITRANYERIAPENCFDFNHFTEFLTREAQAVAHLNTKQTTVKKIFEKKQTTKTASYKMTQKEVKTQRACEFCNGKHAVHACLRFRSSATAERKQFVSQAKLCENCLLKGHETAKCSNTKRCFVCGQQHHTLLHTDNNQNF